MSSAGVARRWPCGARSDYCPLPSRFRIIYRQNPWCLQKRQSVDSVPALRSNAGHQSSVPHRARVPLSVATNSSECPASSFRSHDSPEMNPLIVTDIGNHSVSFSSSAFHPIFAMFPPSTGRILTVPLRDSDGVLSALARISHHGQYGTCQRGDYGRFGGRAQEGVTLLAR
jgi:hypothetical protein